MTSGLHHDRRKHAMTIINDIKTLLRICICSLSNLIVYLAGLFVHRDKKYILFGAWMGEKFADNSRFLYQYLSQNKTKYGIKKVIWVTRNEALNRELNAQGFESYLIGTRESTYWHLKAGIHVVCNMATQSGPFPTDIDIRLSSGAKKVQLWHGVGIKAVGPTSNSSKTNLINRRSKWITDLSNTEVMRKIGLFGGWGEPKLLCTSELNKSINIMNSKMHARNAFLSAYPRYCECTYYFKDELDVIQRIKNYSLSILYLPTFRDKNSNYVLPTNESVFLNFLKEHNIIWIQKPHQADVNGEIFNDHENILNLNPRFDINTILKSVDLIVSDYSSAAFDAVFVGKPVIMYVPDIEGFMSGSNGLLMDLRDLCPSLLANSIEEMISIIQEVVDNEYYSEDRKQTLHKMRLDFFADKSADYDSIWTDIVNAISSK